MWFWVNIFLSFGLLVMGIVLFVNFNTFVVIFGSKLVGRGANSPMPHYGAINELWAQIIDIHGRSKTSYIPPCNGVISHGAQIGGLRVFADHTCKNKRNTNASTVFVHRVVSCVYILMLRPK